MSCGEFQLRMGLTHFFTTEVWTQGGLVTYYVVWGCPGLC